MSGKNIVIVTGMHRSGTSAITRALVCLGLDPGNNLMPGTDDNRTGYWEDRRISDLNDKILAWLGFNWSWLENPDFSRFRLFLPVYKNIFFKTALKLLKIRLSESDNIIIKDPRFCLLLPFWKEIFKKLGADVKYIFCLRNPLEAADSLKKRDSISIETGLSLWMYYAFSFISNLEGEFFIAEYKNLFDSDKLYRSMSAFLGRNYAEYSGSFKAYRSEFLDIELKHNNESMISLEKMTKNYPAVHRFYKLLLSKSSSTYSTDDVFDRWDTDSLHRDVFFSNPRFGDEGKTKFRLYYSDNMDFDETRAVTIVKTGNKCRLVFKLPDTGKIRHFRFDPGENPCCIRILSAVISDGNAVKALRSGYGNYLYNIQDLYVFTNNDPGISFSTNMNNPQEAALDVLIMDNEWEFSNFLLPVLNNIITGYKKDQNEKTARIEILGRQLEGKKIQENELRENLNDVRERLNDYSDRVNHIKKVMDILLGNHIDKIDSSADNLEESLFKIICLMRSRLVNTDERKSVVDFLEENNLRELGRSERKKLCGQLKLITESGLFDVSFYIGNYLNIAVKYKNLAGHYLLFGWKDNYDPSINFSTQFYLSEYKDVREQGMNPLLHYLRYGRKQGRFKKRIEKDIHIIKKSGLFDINYYIREYPDIHIVDIDPVKHFCETGWKENRNPSAEFDIGKYRMKAENELAPDENPLVHFISKYSDKLAT